MTVDKSQKERKTQTVSFLFEGILSLLCLALFTITPLLFVEIKQNEWVSGFIPIRMINAELKFCAVIVIVSLITGLIGIRIHLNAYISRYPPSLILFCGIFILAILLSTYTAHNTTRAWVSSFMWHLLPLALALSLSQLRWNSKRLLVWTGSILLGGVVSSLIVMDQHYQWTDWSHRLTRLGYGGIIFNQNFAAEYHAPLLPIALGLTFYVKSRKVKFSLIAILLLILLPALSLSMARGAWVGLIGSCTITAVISLVVLAKKRKLIDPKYFKYFCLIPSSFLLLAIALPLYLSTSDYWKKGAFTQNTNNTAKTESVELVELKSITTRGSGRRIALWQDAIKASTSGDFLLGKGTDHYELHFHESAEISDKTTGGTLVRFVHNDFLQILYENGIIGLVGFLGIWLVVFWRALLSALVCCRSNDLTTFGLIIALTTACITFLIESFFEFPTRSPCALIIGWTSLGLLLAVSMDKKKSKTETIQIPIKPKYNLLLGTLAVLIIPYGCILAKNLFWSNIFHFQGRIAGDYGEKEKSLKFHRKSISYAPWEHHSRKWECFYLLTLKKQFPEALEAINNTLKVHPGCLVAHQNKISVLLNEFKDKNMAIQAYRDMKKAAPFHPYTEQESQKFPSLKR